MRVFISWSGERSNKVALALRDWLPLVLHYVEPWLSETDIQAGDRWIQSVAQELATANFGIVCVTSENINSPWMLFESGALAKSLETSKVIPLLFDLDFADISGPLTQFQAKKLTREGMEEIVYSLQSSAETPMPEKYAGRLFEVLWPDLERTVAEIPRQAPAQRYVRPQNEVLEELVTSVRALEVRMRQTFTFLQSDVRQRENSNLSWRTALSNADEGTGVQVASVGGLIAVGDAKHPDGPVIMYETSEFATFVEGVKRGEFDNFR